MTELYYTIGLPASGKTTFFEDIKRNKNNIIKISSDSLREELYNDVNNQKHNSKIFEVMRRRTLQALKDGISVYYDATNLSRKRRIAFLKEVPKEIKRIALCFVPPVEDCIEQDKKRDRVVGREVIMRMYKRFFPPNLVEGFNEILYIKKKDEYDIEKILQKNIDCPHDNPHHILSCGEHCLAVENYIQSKFSYKNSEKEQYILLQAGRYHDLSKYKVKNFANIKGNPTKEAHYYGHANASAYDYLCYKFDGSNYMEIISCLIACHMDYYDKNKIRKDREIYGDEFMKWLNILHEADSQCEKEMII